MAELERELRFLGSIEHTFRLDIVLRSTDGSLNRTFILAKELRKLVHTADMDHFSTPYKKFRSKGY